MDRIHVRLELLPPNGKNVFYNLPRKRVTEKIKYKTCAYEGYAIWSQIQLKWVPCRDE